MLKFLKILKRRKLELVFSELGLGSRLLLLLWLLSFNKEVSAGLKSGSSFDHSPEFAGRSLIKVKSVVLDELFKDRRACGSVLQVVQRVLGSDLAPVSSHLVELVEVRTYLDGFEEGLEVLSVLFPGRDLGQKEGILGSSLVPVCFGVHEGFEQISMNNVVQEPSD